MTIRIESACCPPGVVSVWMLWFLGDNLKVGLNAEPWG